MRRSKARQCVLHFTSRMTGLLIDLSCSHLSNNGVQETPPSRGSNGVVDEERRELFVDLDGSNVGFQHWHPVPVTARGDKLGGQGGMGGVWEWTSSPLRKWEGFEPMALYPAYTGMLVFCFALFEQNFILVKA